MDPDPILMGMIWVQIVCKSYKQTSLGGNELIIIHHAPKYNIAWKF